MVAFQYEAFRMSDRSKTSGTISAPSEKEARELLREQNLLPTKLLLVKTHEAADGKKQLNVITTLIQKTMGVSSKEKIAFTRNLAMMIRAGIPLTEALLYYENYATHAKFKKIVARIRQDIISGYSLSQALGKHPTIFNDVYVNVTKAGERSGELDQTMSRMTHLLTKREQLNMKIITAATYPVIVMVILVLVLLVMFLWVLPTFSDIYKQMGIPLPLLTKVMLAISHGFRDYWFISFPILGTVIYSVISFLKTPTGKVFWDAMMLKVPLINELIKHTQSSHLVSTLYVAFSAGLPITDALYLATETLSHTQIQEAFKQANVQIQTGQRLATALSTAAYIPPIVMLMISTGEESGDLEKMLEASSEYLEEEINYRVGVLTSLMEPILLMVIGVVVGFVAMSVYMPMFSLYEHIH